MATEIATIPYLGTLTSTEVHAFAIGFIPVFLLSFTRARAMVRSEVWYCLAGILAAVVLAEAVLTAHAWL